MKIRAISLFVLIVFGLSACVTTYRISSDYEREVDLSNYKTYELLKHEAEFAYGVNPKNIQLIEQAIQREMLANGFKMDENPDLLVAYFVREKLIQEANYSYQGYYKKWGIPLWADVNEYKEGMLIIDLIDRGTKQVVWHGVAKEKVPDNIKDAEGKINELVQAMIEQFIEDSNKVNKVAVLK